MKKLLLPIALIILSCSAEDSCEPTPKLTTAEADNITDVSATISGTITPPTCDDTVTSQGFVYGEENLPTVEDTKIVKSGSTISASLTNLNQNTTYYIRTFFENPLGVFYGNEVMFSTNVGDALVQTNTVFNITATNALISGRVSSNGGGTITSKGFCFSTEANPTVNDQKVDGIDEGNQFKGTLENLTPNTLYYIKAYAENESGVFYGEEKTFETLCLYPELNSVSVEAFKTANYDSKIKVNYSINVNQNYGWDKAYAYLTVNGDRVGSTEIDSSNGEVLIDAGYNKTYGLGFSFEYNDCDTYDIQTNESVSTQSKYTVGDKAEGGIIIYLFNYDGTSGMVAAEYDAGKAAWACDTPFGDWGWLAPGQGNIGDGESSSQSIYRFISEGNGKSPNGYFANFCGNCPSEPTAVELCYDFVIDDYDDWFLPTTATLTKIFELYKDGVIKNIEDSYGCGTSEPIYVSSNADGANARWVNFISTGNYSGYVGRGSFGSKFNVRPVRRF